MLVLSRLLPRLFRSDTQKSAATDTERSSQRWDKSKSKSNYFICRILLLDDTQVTLNVKVSKLLTTRFLVILGLCCMYNNIIHL